LTAFYLEQRYGPAVQVEYVDMHEPANKQRFPDLSAAIEEQHLPFPLVAINGTVRLAGTAHYMQLFPLVEEAFSEAGVPAPEPQTA
jgi:disulfide oxidoreductase YuzD